MTTAKQARSKKTGQRFPQVLVAVYAAALLVLAVGDLVDLVRSGAVTVSVAADEGTEPVALPAGTIEAGHAFPLTVAQDSVSNLAIGLVVTQQVLAIALLLGLAWFARRLVVLALDGDPFGTRSRNVLSWAVGMAGAWALLPRLVGTLAGNTVAGDLGLDVGGHLDQTMVWLVIAGGSLAGALDYALRRAAQLQQDTEGLV